MTGFEDRVARLEEHLVRPSAEEELAKAERIFAEEGDTVWARLAFTGAIHARALERSRESRRPEDDA